MGGWQSGGGAGGAPDHAPPPLSSGDAARSLMHSNEGYRYRTGPLASVGQSRPALIAMTKNRGGQGGDIIRSAARKAAGPGAAESGGKRSAVSAPRVIGSLRRRRPAVSAPPPVAVETLHRETAPERP